MTCMHSKYWLCLGLWVDSDSIHLYNIHLLNILQIIIGAQFTYIFFEPNYNRGTEYRIEGHSLKISQK